MTHRYVDRYFTAEAPKKVFDRLYENAQKPSSLYKTSDPTSSDLSREERELNDHCTFHPQIIGDSPFISERTLRNLAQNSRSRRRKPPPPPNSRSRSRSRSPHKRNQITLDNPLLQSGNYSSREHGLVLGPPAAVDLPIFYYSTAAPPLFAAGTYTALEQVTVTTTEADPAAAAAVEMLEQYEDVEVTDDEATAAAAVNSSNSSSGGLLPPPLPDWAFRAGGPSGEPKKVAKLVISKANKLATAAAEEPSGWQAVLAEMQRRRGGDTLKKVEVEKVKPKPKKKKKKKGAKDFKDVMDELNFKLARLRGEVEDDEEDDDEDEAPPAAAATTAAPAATAPAASTANGSDGGEPTSSGKFPSKASMMNLLSQKLKLPGAPSPTTTATTAAAADEEPEIKKMSRVQSLPAMNLSKMLSARTAAASNNNSNSSNISSVDSGVGKAAVPHPSKVPAAPPLPSAAVAAKWPPAAFCGSYDPKDLVEEVDAPDSTATTTTAAAATTTAITASTISSGSSSELKIKKTVRKLVKKATATTKTAMKTVSRDIFQSVQRPLPVAYYMPQPMIGMVAGAGMITAGGRTSQALVDSVRRAYRALQQQQQHQQQQQSLQQQQQRMDDVAGSIVTGNLSAAATATEMHSQLQQQHQLASVPLTLDSSSAESIGSDDYSTDLDTNNVQLLSAKKTISELPLPNGFHAQIERMQRSNALRAAAREAEQEQQLRKYLNPAYKPSPNCSLANSSSFGGGDAAATAATRLQTSQQQQQRKREPTVARAFVSHVDEHIAMKSHSHRKPALSAAESAAAAGSNDLPLCQRHDGVLRQPMYALLGDPHTTFWASNLRSESASPTRRHQQQRSRSRSTSGRTIATAGGAVSPIRSENYNNNSRWFDTTSSSRHDVSISNDPSSFTTSTAAAAAANESSANRYFRNFRPLTIAKAPKLRAHEITDRRAQEQRDKSTQQQQLELQEEERRRLLKQQLREKALRVAQENGVYRSNANSRYHRHQKMIEKYSQRSDVGFNIAAATKNAFCQYKKKHHLPLNDNDTLYTPAVLADSVAAADRLSSPRQHHNTADTAVASNTISDYYYMDNNNSNNNNNSSRMQNELEVAHRTLQHKAELQLIQTLQQELEEYDDNHNDPRGAIYFAPVSESQQQRQMQHSFQQPQLYQQQQQQQQQKWQQQQQLHQQQQQQLYQQQQQQQPSLRSYRINPNQLFEDASHSEYSSSNLQLLEYRTTRS